jgi:hypothetical protein
MRKSTAARALNPADDKEILDKIDGVADQTERGGLA